MAYKTKRKAKRKKYGVPQLAEDSTKLVVLGTALGVASNLASKQLAK